MKEVVNLLAQELLFLNVAQPVYEIVNYTGTKYIRFMKHSAF